MKRLFTIIALAAAALQLTAQSYNITGSAEGTVDGDTIYLSRNQGYFLIPEDSTYVKDGKFQFSGTQKGVAVRYIQAKHAGQKNLISLAQVVLEPADIQVKMYLAEEKKQHSEITGGPNFQAYEGFNAIGKKYNDELTEPFQTYYYKKGTEAEQKAAKVVVDSISAIIHEEKRQYLLAHMPMPICDIMLGNEYKNWTEAQSKEVMDAFAAKLPDASNYKHLVKEAQENARTAIGGKYIDFTMDDPQGNQVSLSDYISKSRYTLIDFWASWCGPCRKEMPHVVQAYTECHDKGFEVIGVSLDNKKDAWVKAIDDLKMPWPQMSDLKGWQCAGAAIYNVKAIPANVLVDQNGTILAKNLRGEDLLEKVRSLCGTDK